MASVLNVLPEVSFERREDFNNKLVNFASSLAGLSRAEKNDPNWCERASVNWIARYRVFIVPFVFPNRTQRLTVRVALVDFSYTTPSEKSEVQKYPDGIYVCAHEDCNLGCGGAFLVMQTLKIEVVIPNDYSPPFLVSLNELFSAEMEDRVSLVGDNAVPSIIRKAPVAQLRHLSMNRPLISVQRARNGELRRTSYRKGD